MSVVDAGYNYVKMLNKDFESGAMADSIQCPGQTVMLIVLSLILGQTYSCAYAWQWYTQ